MHKKDKTITFKGKGSLFIPRNIIRSEYPEANNNEGGGENNENYTWYDFIRDNVIKPFDDHLEHTGYEDINPVPVAIADIYSDNLNFRLLKDIPITESIANTGILLYDTTPRLANSYGSYGGSPGDITSNLWGLNIPNAPMENSIMQIEIDGNIYYYTGYSGD